MADNLNLSLEQQITEQRERLAAAQRVAESAAREKLAVEQAPQQAIQAEQARLAALERQLDRARQAATAASYRVILDEQRQAFETIIQMLQTGDWQAALTALNVCEGLGQQAASIRQTTERSPLWDVSEQAEYQRLIRDQQTIDAAMLQHLQIEIYVSRLIDSRRPQQPVPPLPPPLDLPQSLADWIAQEPANSPQRRWRAGLVYGISGQLLDNATFVVNPPSLRLMR